MTRDHVTGDPYLHLFAREQPDSNWDEPRVRREVFDIMRIWLDKGIDGFRMDVHPARLEARRPARPARPAGGAPWPEYFFADGPRLHECLAEMRRETLEHYGAVAVGEARGVPLDWTRDLIDERRGQLDLIFNFDAVRIDRGLGWRWKPWRLQDFKAWFTRLDGEMDRHCWPTVYLSNETACDSCLTLATTRSPSAFPPPNYC